MLTIAPQPAVFSNRFDYFGNPAAFFTVQEPHRDLVVLATHVVQITPRLPLEPERISSFVEGRDASGLLPCDRSPAVLDAYQFVFSSRYVRASAELTEYASASFTAARRRMLDARSAWT